MDNHTHQRNKAIEYINKHSKSRWKREYNYDQRALVENVFSRWKTIFGENIRSKKGRAQQVEVTLKSFILNKITDLGMPKLNQENSNSDLIRPLQKKGLEF